MDLESIAAPAEPTPAPAPVTAPPDLSSRPLRFTVEREMSAAPSVLYKAWTRGFDRWFAAPGTLLTPGKVNTAYFFEVREDGMRHPHYGRYLRLERNKVVELTWLTSATLGAETVVTIEIGPRRKHTLLRVTHAGFPDEPSMQRHANAWPRVLEQLERKLAAPHEASPL